jgi:hypothetical protein
MLTYYQASVLRERGKHESALTLGLKKEAKPCLEKSILLLPNLIYSRYYLSQIETRQNNHGQSLLYWKQFVFLCSRTLSKKAFENTITSGEMEQLLAERKNIIDYSYTNKFQKWYHSSTI